jgi:hypothetical protein
MKGKKAKFSKLKKRGKWSNLVENFCLKKKYSQNWTKKNKKFQNSKMVQFRGEFVYGKMIPKLDPKKTPIQPEKRVRKYTPKVGPTNKNIGSTQNEETGLILGRICVRKNTPKIGPKYKNFHNTQERSKERIIPKLYPKKHLCFKTPKRGRWPNLVRGEFV